MKLKLDENMPAALSDLLAHEGYDVDDVRSEGLAGAPDARVIDNAGREGRVLLTFDTDFADVRQYPVGTHAGIAVFRLHDQRWATLEGPVRQLLVHGRLADLAGALVIVDEARVRMRRS